jgi:hypothetical protein
MSAELLNRVADRMAAESKTLASPHAIFALSGDDLRRIAANIHGWSEICRSAARDIARSEELDIPPVPVVGCAHWGGV